MPHPGQFDTPPRIPILTCPNCFTPMRIKTVEAVGDRDRITLACDDCRIEAAQDHQRPT